MKAGSAFGEHPARMKGCAGLFLIIACQPPPPTTYISWSRGGSLKTSPPFTAESVPKGPPRRQDLSLLRGL